MANKNRKQNGKKWRKGKASWDKSVGAGEYPHKDFADFNCSKDNDVSWYSRFPQLLKDAASFPYSYLAGAPFRIDNALTGSNTALQDLKLPGVMRLAYVPTIGPAGSAETPVNIAARNIYTYVRHVNSGHANYDAPDLMMYLLAMDSLYNFHSFIKRVYGVARLYTPTNRYYPSTILKSMKLDPEEIYANLANLRSYINMYAVKLGALCVPSDMDYYSRHSWLNEGLYVDSMSNKAQTYYFMPEGYLQFDNTSSTGSSLTWQSYLHMQMSGQEVDTVNLTLLFNLGNRLMDAVMNDEDFNIMSGDILKAFGDRIVKVDTIPEDYYVLPVYSEEVLSQIHNATICTDNLNTYTISQDVNINQGYITSELTFKAEDVTNAWPAFINSSRFVNMMKDEVTPGDTMVATRLAICGCGSESGTGPIQLSYYGSEVVTSARVFLVTNAQVNDGVLVSQRLQDNADTNRTFNPDVVLNLIYVPQFDWAPQVWCINQSTPDGRKLLPAFDVNNYTIVSPESLARMHEVAMISLFDVPLTSMNR